MLNEKIPYDYTLNFFSDTEVISNIWVKSYIDINRTIFRCFQFKYLTISIQYLATTFFIRIPMADFSQNLQN